MLKKMCLIPTVDEIFILEGEKGSKVNYSYCCQWSGWQLRFIQAVKLSIFCPLSPWCTNASPTLILCSIYHHLCGESKEKVLVRRKTVRGRVFVEEQSLYSTACMCWHILNQHKRQLTGYLKISFLIKSHLFRKH